MNAQIGQLSAGAKRVGPALPAAPNGGYRAWRASLMVTICDVIPAR
jgi:hypothetical protein